MASLNFPAPSASPWTGPNGVTYTWITDGGDGYWSAAPTAADFLKLDASNDPVTGTLELTAGLNVSSGTSYFAERTDCGSAIRCYSVNIPDVTSNNPDDAGCNVRQDGVFLSSRSSTDPENANLTINRMDVNNGRLINFNIKGVTKAYIGGDGAGGVTGITPVSDYRVKENIADLPSTVEVVKALRPVTFNYIDTPEAVSKGFIAHELQAVEPSAAFGQKDAVDEEGNPKYQSVDATKLIPILTKALQEALERIEALENA